MSRSPKMSERLSKKNIFEEKLLRSVPRIIIIFFLWITNLIEMGRTIV